MSKIVPQSNLRSWPAGLPLENMSVEVLVPYDARTGKVYLNACGADENEIASALAAIEMPDDQRPQMKSIIATLDFSDSAALQSSLFPVHVPVHIETGKVFLGGIGSNAVEADANLSFANVDVDDYRIVTAMMRMPTLTIDQDIEANLLPFPRR
jgi:hypothetical protein